MSGVKRTRNSSELGPRKHDDRTKEVSQNANWWLGSKAVKEKTPEKIRNDSKRRRVQKEGEWEIRRSNLEAYKLGSSSSSSSSNIDVFDSASSNIEQYRRRMAISYMMEIANYPHPDTWESLKLFSQIEERLVIPKNSRTKTRKILNDIYECHMKGETYDPRGQASLRGARVAIQEESEEASLILSLLDKGVMPGGVLMFVNYERSQRNESPIGKKAIEGFIDRDARIKKSRRLTKKAGKNDPTSKWAVARLVQFTQLQEQFTLSPFARSNIEKNIDEAERFQQFADILTPGNNEEEKNEDDNMDLA